MTVTVEISYGELLDKISILGIKLEHAGDGVQRHNIERELMVLNQARDQVFREAHVGGDHERVDIVELCGRLKEVNERLWQVEDDIRDCERRRDFGGAFVALARTVYRLNDRRAGFKRRLNVLLCSPLVEEKLYEDY